MAVTLVGTCTAYAYTGFNAAFRFNAPWPSTSFAAGAQNAGLIVLKPNYVGLVDVPPSPPARTYGGSDPTSPSFLRPDFVKYNSVSKSRDFGSVESILAEVSGLIGSQSGSNTLYFKFTLLSPADVRIEKLATGNFTDHYLSVGLLNADLTPLPLDPDGFGFINDIHNTEGDESILKLPVGTYFATISTMQWQSIPFALQISVIRFTLLSGVALGSLSPSARLPLQKAFGNAGGTAPFAGTIQPPSQIKKLIGAAAGTAQPLLTLVIPSGVAGGSMLPYGRLMMHWRLSGTAQGSNTSVGTLTSEAPYGYGY